MGFFKKSLTVAQKMEAVQERIEVLKGWKEKQEKEIVEKKEAVAELLGSLALDENTETRNSHRLAKTALSRMTENLQDINSQIDLLQGQRVEIEKEFSEAEIREIPGRVEKIATDFNALLDQAFETMQVLKGIHASMQQKAKDYQDQTDQYQAGCIKLGIVQPMDLKVGLGHAAKVGSPCGGSFNVPSFDYFLSALISYKEKIEGWKKDPNWTAPPDPNQGKDFGPWSVHQRPNRAL